MKEDMKRDGRRPDKRAPKFSPPGRKGPEARRPADTRAAQRPGRAFGDRTDRYSRPAPPSGVRRGLPKELRRPAAGPPARRVERPQQVRRPPVVERREEARVPDIIAGRNPVLEALKAGRPFNRIMLARGVRTDPVISEILTVARNRAIPVEHVERQAIDRLGLGGVNQGVLGYAAAKDYVSLEDLLAIPSAKGEAALFCILDGIEDPMNLGAILRTAGATGIHGVVIRSRRAVGLTPTVAKASAGAIEYVPVARVVNIAETIETLKKNNIWVTGIDMEGKADFEKVDFRLPSAIVIGGEGSGLSALVKERCDTIARIPIKGQISSLNASVAAAIVMYGAFRQRSA